MVSNDIIDKLFYHQIFTIAIRNKIGLDLNSNTFGDEPFSVVLKAKVNNWYADPFIIEHDGKRYIFFENVSQGRRKLQVGVINGMHSIDDIRDILDEPIGLSYPFVFNAADQWYLIPESHEAKEIRLYKALDFPYVWALNRVLFKDIDAVDTTVFEYNGYSYIITAVRQTDGEGVQPRIFKLTHELPEDWMLDELPWEDYDMSQSRSAGRIFKINDRFYRPSQICTRFEYGKGIMINEIDVHSLNNGKYREKDIVKITPESVSLLNLHNKVTGIHTYNSSKDYEVIDVKFKQFQLQKLFRSLKRRMSSALADDSSREI